MSEQKAVVRIRLARIVIDLSICSEIVNYMHCLYNVHIMDHSGLTGAFETFQKKCSERFESRTDRDMTLRARTTRARLFALKTNRTERQVAF